MPNPSATRNSRYWFRASVRRCRSTRSGLPSRATEWIADRPDLGVVGAVGGPLGAEVGLVIGAGTLTVRRVGIDRQTLGKGDDRRPELRRRRRTVQRLWIAEADVETRGGVGLFGRRRREEDRLEGLFFAFGDRRVGRLRVGGVLWVLVGLDFEPDREAARQCRSWGCRSTGGPGSPRSSVRQCSPCRSSAGQPAGLPGAPLAKRWAS